MRRREAACRRRNEIDARAADWLARRNGGLTEREEADLAAWLAADPQHAAAFVEFVAAWEALQAPRRSGEAELVRNALSMRRRRARALLAMAGLGVAAAAALVVLFVRPRVPPGVATPLPVTAVLRPDRQTLPDGSVIELSAGAEFDVVFTAARRGVVLRKGEALFAVAKDKVPFVVSAGAVEVRAVGTEFSVRHQPTGVGVLVTEGRVAVQRIAVATTSPAAVYLDAGRKVVVPAAAGPAEPLQVTSVPPAEIAAALAWRGRRIEFTHTPLVEAAALFNRQNRMQLAIPDSRLGARRITGIFWSDDPEAFVRLLESGLDLRGERVGDTIVLRGVD